MLFIGVVEPSSSHMSREKLLVGPLQAAVTKNSLHCTKWAGGRCTVLSVAPPKWLDEVLRHKSGTIISVQYAVQTPLHACSTSKKS